MQSTREGILLSGYPGTVRRQQPTPLPAREFTCAFPRKQKTSLTAWVAFSAGHRCTSPPTAAANTPLCLPAASARRHAAALSPSITACLRVKRPAKHSEPQRTRTCGDIEMRARAHAHRLPRQSVCRAPPQPASPHSASNDKGLVLS